MTGKCLECQGSYLLDNGLCVATCNAGFYSAFNNKECVQCPKLCILCNSYAQCMQCRSDAYMQGGKCEPHCSEG